ncbi:MAG: TIGR02450 family Trp-rich protein [Idiomarina sp.]|nr:TIGR02450 family Trp-rich protein [Idiomarina sp.]
MNQINPNKLLNSKWTAVKPISREKHFLVAEVEYDEDGTVTLCNIESVLSNNSYEIDWLELKDATK